MTFRVAVDAAFVDVVVVTCVFRAIAEAAEEAEKKFAEAAEKWKQEQVRLSWAGTDVCTRLFALLA